MMHWALQLISLVPYFGSAGGLLLLKGIVLPTFTKVLSLGGLSYWFSLSNIVKCLTVYNACNQSAVGMKIWMFDFRLG